MLLLANLVDLTAIASLGSVVALAIFLVPSVAAFRLRRETGSSTPGSSWRRSSLTASVLLVFAVQTLRNEPETFVAMVGSPRRWPSVLDLVWTRVRARRQSRP